MLVKGKLENNNSTWNCLLNIPQNFPLYKALKHIKTNKKNKTISLIYTKKVGFFLQTALTTFKIFLR